MPGSTFTASIQAIPGFMAAMAMPFEVRQSERPRRPACQEPLSSLCWSSTGTSSYAERIRVVRYQSTEQDPLAASRLKLLTQVAGAQLREGHWPSARQCPTSH